MLIEILRAWALVRWYALRDMLALEIARIVVLLFAAVGWNILLNLIINFLDSFLLLGWRRVLLISSLVEVVFRGLGFGLSLLLPLSRLAFPLLLRHGLLWRLVRSVSFGED